MALYQYIAKTRDGKNIKDVIDADSHDEVVNRLRAKDLFIISISDMSERKKDSSFKKFSFFKNKGKHNSINYIDMSYFARSLTMTLSAGVPLLKSIEITSFQTESLKLAGVLGKIKDDIRAGFSLSESVERYPDIFSPLWKGIIEVGEASGNLPFVLDRLADYLERSAEFERKIKSALIYPTIVSIFGLIAITVFFRYILPRFTEIFTQFDIKLPLFTKILFNFSHFVNDYFIVIIIFIAASIIGIFYIKKKNIARGFIDRIKLSLPLLNSFTLMVAVERFSSMMYILIGSGVPIVYALSVIAKSIDNKVLEDTVNLVRDNVKKGKSLSSEISKTNVFPILISEIARVGEETGDMPAMFKKLSEHYQKELTTRMEHLVAVFEPLTIFLLGIIIGIVVIALFMPIFKLATLGS